MADGTIRVGTKIDFSGVKADVKALEKELAAIQKKADKLNAQEKKVTDRYNEARELDKQFPEEFSHREQIDEKYSKQLDPIIKEREILNQKAQEYNALLEEANAKLQQQSAIAQADKELNGAVKSAGALDKIQTEEQYQSMLARTRVQLERISVEAEKIAAKHGLSKEQLLANNAEYQKLSDLLTQLEGKQGQFKKTTEKTMKSAQKNTNKLGDTIKKSIKQVTKMGLAMLGVRSAFMAFRKAINTYMQSNEKLKNQLDSLWNIAGQAIGPFVEALVKGISTLVMWVNSLVEALSGINLVAKANAAALKKQASAAKSASLAGFDEMNKLSDDSGSSNSGLFDTSMAGGTPAFIEDIKQKILSGDWFGAGETAGEALMNGIMSIEWGNLGEKIGGVLGDAVSFLLGFATNIDPFQLLGVITELLGNLLESAAQAIEELDWAEIGAKLVKALLFGIAMSNPFALLLTILLSPNGDELASGAAELMGAVVGALFKAIIGLAQEIGRLVKELWNTIKTYFDDYVDWEGTPADIINGLLDGILDAVINIGKWIKDNIWIPFRDGFKKAFGIDSPSKKMAEFGKLIIDGLCNGITGAIGKVKQACTIIWEAIKEKFSNVGDWFKQVFTAAWQNVKDVFSVGGKIFDGIKDGISSTFKTIVNGLIGGINKVIALPFDGINKMLNTIRDISFLGISPFKNLWSYNPLSVPQIPKLAVGGIVNRPGRGVPAIIGEAGAEAVLPLENNTEWMDMLAEKIGGNVTIPIYMDGKKIATYVVDIQKKKAFAMNGA